jgi:protein phosphatase
MSNLNDTIEMLSSPQLPGVQRPESLSAQVRVDVGGLSHPGKVRPNNEDHYCVARFGRHLEVLGTNLPAGMVPSRFDEVGYGAVVADGIGGHAGGEVASRLAINTLVNLVLSTPDWILRLDEEAYQEEVKRRAAERYEQVGKVLTGEADADPALAGFGTTMTMTVSLGKNLIVVHIGDSRAYLLREGTLHQLTRDHTVVQALVDLGIISRQEVATHRRRHVLMKSLNAQCGRVEPDVHDVLLAGGDCVLLCTDGLTEMVTNARIAEILGGAESAENTCRALVDEALKNGGKDNVTVVVARYQFPEGS